MTVLRAVTVRSIIATAGSRPAVLRFRFQPGEEMPRKQEASTGPSQRQQRVAELIRHALSEVLARGDIQDPVLSSHVVTVPEVRMSPDLKLATAYVMPLGGRDERPVLEALDRLRKVLRQEVARRVNLKFAPDLRFRRDETFDEAARIDALLRSDKVRRDIEPDDGEPGEDPRQGPPA